MDAPLCIKFAEIIDKKYVLNQVTIGFAYGPNDKLSSRTTAELALPQKIFEPTVWGNKIKITSALPAKIWTPVCFRVSVSCGLTRPPPCGHSLLGGRARVSLGWGAEGRKRILPDIHGVL